MKEFFEGLYSRFILRDIFCKVAPGAILLLAFALWWGFPYSSIVWFAIDHSWGFWLIFFSSAWLMGFAIQYFAERIHFLEYFPPGLRLTRNKNIDQYNSEFFLIVRDFLKESVNDEHSKRNERFEVIKEACGNAAATVVLASGVVMARVLFEIFVKDNFSFSLGAFRPALWLFPFFVLVSVLSYIFYSMHLENCIRQYTYSWHLLYMNKRINEDGKIISENDKILNTLTWPNNDNLRSGKLNWYKLIFVCICAWIVFGLIGGFSGLLLQGQ